MQKTNKKILLLALLLTVLTAVVAQRFLTGLEKAAAEGNLEDVVVAVRDIPARTMLTGDMLSVVQVATGARHPGAVQAKDQLVGKLTVQPLVAGEQVLLARIFSSADQSGLAYQIPDGYRAVSVGANLRVAVNYYLRPGDYVDVIASFDLPVPDKFEPLTKEVREQYSRILLENVAVLAVGPEIRAGTAGVVGSETVTLAVTPAQAEKLVWAEDYGKIRLALRPATDNTTVNTGGVTARELKGPR